jgi:2-aminoadipate transaminase
MSGLCRQSMTAGTKKYWAKNEGQRMMGRMDDQPEMNWSRCFAGRTELMKRSALRELMKVTARPDIISFAGGMPAAELFPVARVKSALAAALDARGGQALQYSATEGLPELRDWLARRFSNERLAVRRENVLITSGAQQGLDLIGRVLLEEGDRVIVENPTYLALLAAWRPTGVEFLPAACDAGGPRVEEWESLLRQKPKAVFCVPNFQNPQGTTMSLTRREKLVALARQSSMAVVEDNPYGDLRYSGSALPNLLRLDARNQSSSDFDSVVVHTGTFSKVLMPGLRVGWVIASRAVIEKLTQAKQAADLHTGTLSQHLALELASHGFLEEFLPVLLQNYGRRLDAMLVALEKYFPKSATWTKPEGGMFLWVTLPEHIDAGQLLPAALEEGVAFVPGEEFHLNGEGQNTLRLNFSNPPPERIEEGIKKLGRLLVEFGD